MNKYYIHAANVYYILENGRIEFLSISRNEILRSILNREVVEEDNVWDSIIEADSPREAWEIYKLLGEGNG